MTTKKRNTSTDRVVTAACRRCGATWSGGGAQGSAAHHHDETGHVTVATVRMIVTYGVGPATSPPPVRVPGTRRQRARTWRAG